MKKFTELLAKILVFFVVAGFSFLMIAIILGGMEPADPEGFLVIIQMFAAFAAPPIIGGLVVRKVFKAEKECENSPELNANIDDILQDDTSTLSIIKEELSCWNWQLIVGSLILLAGLIKIIPNFFLGILLIVLGLGIFSVGGTKYREKQEMQERELRRKLYAAVEKESASRGDQTKPTAAAGSGKRTTHRVAGVSFYVKNIESIGIENEDYFKSKREMIADDLINERIWKYKFFGNTAQLQPEPDNPKDHNAIKVIVDGYHMGYIKKGSCAHVHKLIRDHAIADIICDVGGGPYKYLAEEYDDEKSKNTYVLEDGEISYFVHLEIQERTDAS